MLIDIIYDISNLETVVSDEEEAGRILPYLDTLLDAVTNCERLYAQESQMDSWHSFPFPFSQRESAEDELWLSGGDFCSTTLPAVFHAVRIMIYHLIVRRKPNTDLLVESITRSASLLAFAEALFTRNLHDRLNTGSCVQLVFPLEMVSWYSPCSHQRQKAGDVLNRLGWMQSATR